MQNRDDTRVLVVAALIVGACWSLTAQQAGIATTPRPVVSQATIARGAIARTRTDALSTVRGNALNSTNGAMNDALVRLRDARFGRIVDTQLTDKSGLFAFKAVDPGSYIVEVVTNDQSVLAASQLLNVNGGEAVSAVVKLPFRIPPLAGVLGGANAPAATAIAGEAAASSIAAIVPTDPVSPVQ
ncbi:MAG: hypothetical protein JWL71_2238 [Acidobacteria bacterium]|nr:hypothetical protein [Acidobacteriota bacterium]